MSQKRYISDVIGEEYKSWKPCDRILLSASTGTGKTTFVLHKLLSYIVREQKDSCTLPKEKMLYLVNRKILKAQIEEILDNEVENEIFADNRSSTKAWHDYIKVMTYQSIEKDLKGNTSNSISIINEILSYQWIVYDECHYFYADSNFNTNTELSYDCLRRLCMDKVQIFMSATMECVKSTLCERKEMFLDGIEYLYDYSQREASKKMIHNGRASKSQSYEYESTIGYKNANVQVINEISDIEENILQSAKNNKWLIFVDNIERGKRFKDELTRTNKGRGSLSDEDVVFIDAKYEQEEKPYVTVGQILVSQRADAKVIISTEVMDNGISIHDIDLRNIVIVADTKESFIQMLGRRRSDDNRFNLYICKQDPVHFSRRRDIMKNVNKCYLRYSREFRSVNMRLTRYANCNDSQGEGQNSQYSLQLGEKEINMFLEIDLLNRSLSSYSPPIPNCVYDPQYLITNQKNLINDLITDPYVYKYLRKICYSVNGHLAVNSFALKRCHDLLKFYDNMYQELQKNENAFAIEQMHWLEFDDETINNILTESAQSMYDKYREHLETEIEKVLDETKSYQEMTQWKVDQKNYLKYFCEMEEENKDAAKSIGKNDRMIPLDVFDACMKQAKLNYELITVDENGNLKEVKRISKDTTKYKIRKKAR